MENGYYSRKETDWRDRAECINADDPELFFPVGETGPAAIQIEKAKEYCGRCAVRESCLDWAMEHNEEHGIWGGLSENERHSLKRSRQRLRAKNIK